MSYVDVLYIYAIARAGYIPQLFSLRLPNPEVIYELLTKADGKAIIYEPELADTVLDDLKVFVHGNKGCADVDRENNTPKHCYTIIIFLGPPYSTTTFRSATSTLLTI